MTKLKVFLNNSKNSTREDQMLIKFCKLLSRSSDFFQPASTAEETTYISGERSNLWFLFFYLFFSTWFHFIFSLYIVTIHTMTWPIFSKFSQQLIFDFKKYIIYFGIHYTKIHHLNYIYLSLHYWKVSLTNILLLCFSFVVLKKRFCLCWTKFQDVDIEFCEPWTVWQTSCRTCSHVFMTIFIGVSIFSNIDVNIFRYEKYQI